MSVTPKDMKAVPSALEREVARLREEITNVASADLRDHQKIFDHLSEMRADRRWYKWMAGAISTAMVGFVSVAIALVVSGSNRLDAVEEAIKDVAGAIQVGLQIDNGLRRDIDEHREDIKALERRRGHMPGKD